MRKLIILLILCSLSVNGWGQAKAAKKMMEKMSVKSTKKAAFEAAKKRSEKELLKEGMARTGRKYTGQALGDRIVRRSLRESVMKEMEKEGITSFLEYGYRQALKDLRSLGVSNFKRGVINKEAATATKPTAYHMLIENNALQAGKRASKDEAKKLLGKTVGKKGYKAFMKMTVRERMTNIVSLTKYIYDLPKAEQDKVLAKLAPELRDKVIKTRKLMTSRFPSSKKGIFKGEKGNSDFVLSDNYVWTDKKTGQRMTVGELRKKYNIKEPITIPYRNGEPDFSNYAFGKVKVNYADDIDYKDLKGLHDQANVKLSNEKWVKERQRDDAINPARDLIENMTTDGQYKKGCRNTFHETWDGETILIVPDFINDICTHNGGRALAQIVQ